MRKNRLGTHMIATVNLDIVSVRKDCPRHSRSSIGSYIAWTILTNGIDKVPKAPSDQIGLSLNT